MSTTKNYNQEDIGADIRKDLREDIQNYPNDPYLIWQYFKEISSIPRGSGNEIRIREYLISFAKKNNFQYKTDQIGNVYIYVPATAGSGYEKHQSILIQNHMDMVCDATHDMSIDFKKDSIKLITTKDGYVSAYKTTLGADNGIGMAIALAISTTSSDSNPSEEVIHPPLELLFTVEEETGLIGAQNIKKEFISSKRILNFDTGNFGSFYIGCAGSIKVEFKNNFSEEDAVESTPAYRLKVSGFQGGHSGIEINKQRGNAIKFLVDCLNKLDTQKIEYSLHGFNAGKAHNIIPREALVVICIDRSLEDQVKAILNQTKNDWISFLPREDQHFTISFEPCPVHIHTDNEATKVLSKKDKKRFLSILNLIPDGVASYSLDSNLISNGQYMLPSLSSNFAICKLHDGVMLLESSIRYSNAKECLKLLNTFENIANIADISIKVNWAYGGWEAKFNDNKLLNIVSECYENIFMEKPKMLVTHAGLECGVIVDQLASKDVLEEKIEALSLGANISGIHTPDEQVEIASVQKFWKLITSVMKAF